MGKLLNDHLVEDLMLFGVQASGAFDHVDCQHTGEFDYKKKVKNILKMPRGFARRGRMGSFGIDWYITETHLTSLMKFVRFERKKYSFQTVFP